MGGFTLMWWLLLWTASAQNSRPEEMTVEARDAHARQIYENGTLLYEEGLYEDAIAAFQEAYRLSGIHKLLLNVANCYERLGAYEKAIAVLNRYRAFAPSDQHETLKSRIASNYRRIATTEAYVPEGVVALPIPALQTPLPRPRATAEPTR